MKATALVTFRDLKEKAVRKKGEIFEVTKKRLDEINSTHHGELAEAIEEAKNEQSN